jgi:hypothetical protein
MVLPKWNLTGHAEITEFGWPFAATVQNILVLRDDRQRIVEKQVMKSATSYLLWSINGLNIFLIVFVSWFLCEWLIRHRVARKGA